MVRTEIMGWILNQKIGTRLRYGFGIVVALVVALGAIAIVEMNLVANTTRQLHEHPLKVSNAVRDIQSEVVEMHRSLKDLLLAVNAEHIQATLDEMDKGEKAVESLFGILTERYLGNKDEVHAAYRAFVDWKPIYREAIELIRKGQIQAATEIVRGRAEDKVDAIQELIVPISDFATGKAELFYRESLRSRRHHLLAMTGLIVLIAGASIVTGTMITRSITDPIGQIIGEMGKVGGGDLGHKIRMDRTDEIGHLARAFNEMTENLQKTTASRNELNAANQQLGAANQQLAANEQQLRATNEQLQAANQQLQATEQQLRASNQQLQANELQLRAANQELKANAAELSFRNAELQGIVYTVSHDLKSPLVNIKGFSEELEVQGCKLIKHLSLVDLPPTIQKEVQPLLEEEIPKSLHFIQASTAKMKGLLDGFLRVSKIRSAPIQKETLDMNALVESVLATMRYQIESGQVTVTVDDLPPCVGDSGQINQVISNLVDNALKYRDQNRPGAIHISGRRDGDCVTYWVKDNGIGIDPRHQGRVFEMFHRLDPNFPVSGDGLGLTIVSRILDRHQGRIRLESELGKGSTFYISLPMDSCCPQSSSAAMTRGL
jgi:signal transduction histidine kinase